MQSPSIGRIVHYNQNGNRVAAIITYVYSDTCVQLQTFGKKAAVFDSVQFENELPDPGTGGFLRDTMNTSMSTWSWPPFVGSPSQRDDSGNKKEPQFRATDTVMGKPINASLDVDATKPTEIK